MEYVKKKYIYYFSIIDFFQFLNKWMHVDADDTGTGLSRDHLEVINYLYNWYNTRLILTPKRHPALSNGSKITSFNEKFHFGLRRFIWFWRQFCQDCFSRTKKKNKCLFITSLTTIFEGKDYLVWVSQREISSRSRRPIFS